MTSPSQSGKVPPGCHKPIVDNFIQRLIGAISQSPLLRTKVSRTGRILDCHRLEQVASGLSNDLLERLVDGAETVEVQLDLRALQDDKSEKAEPLFGGGDEREQKIDDQIAQEHLQLHKTLERMSRDADLVKRETGRHALWLGYPFLRATAGDTDIFAPVFLWPISIQFDYRRQGRILIGRAEKQKVALSPRFNRAMAEWVRRQLQVQLADFRDAELSGFDLEDVEKGLQEIGAGFHPKLPQIDCEALLEPVPTPKTLESRKSPLFYNSAVIGYLRWQNEAILADLETIRKQDECPGFAGDFVCGFELPQPPKVTAPSEEDRFLVHDADFSQERAVWQARAQPGLVVHGPPGTGKSQTIVNIIADALAHSRTVLMVCQKQAATRVVLERLGAVGLKDLCVEVHDAAANRLEVFNKIRKQVEDLKSKPSKVERIRAELSFQILEKERLLDEHARAFHEQHPRIGLSYKQMRARECLLLEKFPTVRELRSLHTALLKLSGKQVGEFRQRIQAAGQLFHIADPLNNPWRGRHPTVMSSPALRVDVYAALENLSLLDGQHLQHVDDNGAGGTFPVNLADFISVASDVLERLRQLRDSNSLLTIMRGWTGLVRTCNETKLREKERQCQAALELAKEVTKTALNPQWRAFCENRTDSELKRLSNRAQKVLTDRGRWWAAFDPRSWLAKRALDKINPNAADARWEVAKSLLDHVHADKVRRELREINENLVPLVRAKEDEKYQTKFPQTANRAFAMACWFQQKEQAHDWIKPLTDQILKDANQLEPILDVLEKCVLRSPFVQKLLKELGAMESFLTPQALEEPSADIRAGRSIHSWIDCLRIGLDKLESLIALDADRKHRTGSVAEVLEVLEAYEKLLANGEKLPAPDGQLSPGQYGEWWAALVEYTAIQIWQRECHSEYPVLLQITPEVHQKTREELADLLARKRQIEAEAIQECWLKRQLHYKDRPWTKLFQLRSSNLSRAPRLREAIEASLQNGLLDMRPCWLVNPEAAAQIFPLASGLFDVVIFDEASQCPIEQAVPAIYRGKSLIVAGDEKQLPPTDFFSARAGGDGADDEEIEEEATDETVKTEERPHSKLGVQFMLETEDLLQAAIGNLLPRWLSVHYRSEHPDLIEFSNRAFYFGRLEAPPSRFTSNSEPRPIDFYHVGGVYSRRTNQQEATKVVQLLKDFWSRDGSAPTIGVVTFNQPQRELIEDLIAEECERDDAFAVRYDQEKAREQDKQDVGFFVKNLENVQGDERDVMIFSTTFGRDPSGRFYRRFGPVGAKGGERRLNVAVTRAKKQIIVVTSMPIEEVSDALQAGSNPGVGITPAGYLQLYLAYAKAVSEGNLERRNYILDLLSRRSEPANPIGDTESPLEEEVREALERSGHTVHSQVGESGFRIDLAVLHPDPTRGYMLGIECDGATYHSDRSARIRDVWREKILRNRGWRLHRIWSTRWWYHRADETERLDNAISDAAAQEFQHSNAGGTETQRNETRTSLA